MSSASGSCANSRTAGSSRACAQGPCSRTRATRSMRRDRCADPGLHGTHSVSGTGMDAGMQMPCRWVPLDDRPLLWGEPDPFVEILRSSIETDVTRRLLFSSSACSRSEAPRPRRCACRPRHAVRSSRSRIPGTSASTTCRSRRAPTRSSIRSEPAGACMPTSAQGSGRARRSGSRSPSSASGRRRSASPSSTPASQTAARIRSPAM